MTKIWPNSLGSFVSQCPTSQTSHTATGKNREGFNPLAYTDVPETAGLARSINTQPAVRRNSETNPTSQHNRGMYWVNKN